MRALAVMCLVGTAQAAVLRVPPDQVPTLVNSGAFDVIVDVRAHDEYAKGHLPGAVRGVSELPPECRTAKVKIAVYCWTGWDRSTPAAYYLDSQISEEGATVYDMGGFQYYDNPPLEYGEPTYTQEDLVQICTADPSGEGSELEAEAELLPPLFEEDDDENAAVSEPEPEPSNTLATPDDGKDSTPPSNVDMEKHEYAVVHRIKAEKAAKLAPSFDYVVDARGKAEYDQGHLPGAVFGVEAIPADCKDAYIAVYCWHGWDRSSAAALYLASQGFKHVYDLGGIQYMNVPQGSLATTETTAKSCPEGGSAADVEAIRAAEPTEMPDSFVDGRKGCDGMINSGKTYDVCGICDGPGSGKECDRTTSSSEAAQRKREVDAESDGIIATVCVLGAICLSIGMYLIWNKNDATPRDGMEGNQTRALTKEKKKMQTQVMVAMPEKQQKSESPFTSVTVSVLPAASSRKARPKPPPPPPMVDKLSETAQEKPSKANKTLVPFALPPPPPVKE